MTQLSTTEPRRVRCHLAGVIVEGIAWDDGRAPGMGMLHRDGVVYAHPIAVANIVEVLGPAHAFLADEDGLVLCGHCNTRPAACIGQYDNMPDTAPAGSMCCGHCNEDGFIDPIDAVLHQSAAKT